MRIGIDRDRDLGVRGRQVLAWGAAFIVIIQVASRPFDISCKVASFSVKTFVRFVNSVTAAFSQLKGLLKGGAMTKPTSRASEAMTER